VSGSLPRASLLIGLFAGAQLALTLAGGIASTAAAEQLPAHATPSPAASAAAGAASAPRQAASAPLPPRPRTATPFARPFTLGRHQADGPCPHCDPR
jgi:hypothetical protein